jgi:hypothetical protein
VERFSGAGVFESVFSLNVVGSSLYALPGGLAVDSSGAGAVYVSAYETPAYSGVVLKYSTAGTLLYALDASGSGTTINGGAAVAVDPSDGSVYASATLTDGSGGQVVDVFDGATGLFVSSFDGADAGGFACPSELAADGAGSVYVAESCLGRVNRFSTSGVLAASFADSAGVVAGVAVDPGSGEVYVAGFGATGLQVTEFGAGGGAVVGRFDAPEVGALYAMAVDPGSGTVFTADYANAVVQRYTSFVGPTVTTTPVSGVGAGSVTLNGAIDPGGVSSSYHFEWGLDTSYGTSTPVADAGSGSGAVPALAVVSGLRPNTGYHYRIVGSNGAGSITGDDLAFTTATTPPTVDGSPLVTEITPTSANVHGTVNPGHSDTTFYVEYGTDTTYGTSTTPASAGGADAAGPVAASLTGLQPGTVYHYRIVADNGTGGPQHGTDGSFVTAPAAPATASDLTTRKATLTGTVDPHGVATSYHFDYGPSTSYGASTDETQAGSGDAEQAVSQPVSGLDPGTTYHVQLVATTDGITHTGADVTFTTAPAPVATAAEATAVTTSTATVAGTVDTHGLVGSYHFELSSLDSAYTVATAEQAAPGGVGVHGVSAAVDGLPADETFAVQLVLSSNDSVDYSDQVTFSSPALPRVFPAPPPPSALYGCTAPVLHAFNAHPKPASTVQITGADLGVGGTVTLGDRSLTPQDWTSSGFRVEIPTDARGTLGLTVNCATVSNTIAIAVYQQPANTFTITKKTVAGNTATLAVKVPGPGKLQSTGSHTTATTTKIAKASTKTIKIKLTSAGAKTLHKTNSAKLKIAVRVRYTPTGGLPHTQTTTLTYTRNTNGHA